MALFMIKRTTYLFFVFLLISPLIVFSENNSDIWKKISGRWSIVQYNNASVLVQTKIPAYPWQYNEPLNYNSLMLSEPNEYSKIRYVFEIKNPTNSFELILFLNSEFSETSRYHNLYAFRLSGSNDKIRNCFFVCSHIIDPSNMKKKNNFKVKELASTYCAISTINKMECEIQVRDDIASLYVNNIKIQTYKASEPLNNGIVGFGIKNAQLAVYDFMLQNNNKIIIHDTFTKDSIYRTSIKVNHISKEEYDRLKKQEQERKNK